MKNVRLALDQEQLAREDAPLSQRDEARQPPNARIHRLAEIRQREGISVRAMARRLGITSTEVRRQEKSSADIPLRVVAEWAAALRMPIAELFSDTDDNLPPQLYRRANLLRAMKVARAIQERAKEATIRRYAAEIIERLLAVMPELEEVSAEYKLGECRQAKLGRAATETIPTAWLTGSDQDFGES